MLCVWSDSVKTIVADVEKLEKALLDFVWNHEHAQQKMTLPSLPGFAHATGAEAPAVDAVDADAEDTALAEQKRQWKERPAMVYDAMIAGSGVVLISALIGLSYRKSVSGGIYCLPKSDQYLHTGTLIKQYLLDGKPARFALVFVTPLIVPLMMVCKLGISVSSHAHGAYSFTTVLLLMSCWKFGMLESDDSRWYRTC